MVHPEFDCSALPAPPGLLMLHVMKTPALWNAGPICTLEEQAPRGGAADGYRYVHRAINAGRRTSFCYEKPAITPGKNGPTSNRPKCENIINTVLPHCQTVSAISRQWIDPLLLQVLEGRLSPHERQQCFHPVKGLRFHFYVAFQVHGIPR